MADRVTPFPASKPDAGYDTFHSDFRSDHALHQDSTNLTAGFALGIGPRFGMSPIPGQLDKEAPSDALIGGLMATEGATTANAYGMQNRLKILGVVPVKFNTWDNVGVKKTHYMFITSGTVYNEFTLTYHNLLSAVFNSTQEVVHTPPPYLLFKFNPNIALGIGQTNYFSTNIINSNVLNLFYYSPGNPSYLGSMQDAYTIDTSINFASVATLVVPSRPQPNTWRIGQVVAAPSATDPGNFQTLLYGMSSAFYLGNMPKTIRPVNVFSYGLDFPTVPYSWLYKQYIYTTKTFDSTYYKPRYYLNMSFFGPYLGDVELDAVAADVVIPAADHPAPASTTGSPIVINDEGLVLENNYQLVCVAAKKAYAFYLNDWEKSDHGSPVSLIDLTNQVTFPKPQRTAIPGGGNFYTENTIQALTGWFYWPSYASGTPLVKDSAAAYNGYFHVTLGAAGSGVLRANRSYEIAYSVYNKKLNFETNVCKPAKIRTATDDFVALSLYRDSKIYGTSATEFDQIFPGNATPPISFGFDNNIRVNTNHLEFRIYYRELGSYEWLPALTIDAAKYFGNPNNQIVWACEGTAVGTVGGQPGGFNDYSPLPVEDYTCCVAFKGRMFWLSSRNMHYSLTNNPICYPINNTFAVPTGEFRGSIVHQFRGESSLDSQLIVFGSKEVYFGDFTGETTIASVQISPDNVAQFPIDGSDFVLQTMSTNTAFSYRSAVSADGDLYYWGPQGIFFREGSSKPVKISLNIEPELASLYDGSKTDQIHCVFDDMTREITWFYPPKVADATYPTYGLSFNIDNREFYPQKFKGQVDGSQKLTIEDSDSPTVANGNRTLVFNRDTSASTVQRAYFFDHFNKCGDIFPTDEFMVKSFATPVAGQRTFTLAAGYDSGKVSSLVAGDLIAVVNADEYAPSLTLAQPFIGAVVSTGTGTITVALPAGISFDASASLAHAEYFQLYAQRVNAFTFRLESQYWCPGGMGKFWYFLYLYGLFKLNPLLENDESVTQELNLYYKTILNELPYAAEEPGTVPGYVADTLRIRDNSDGNYQVYKALLQSHAFAQGIKFAIAGEHFAGSWVLQYLELLAQDQTDDQIKMFEE